MTDGSLFSEAEGATPLDPNDARGLIPTWLATRADLNRVEGENITRALAWAASKGGPRTVEALMTESTLRTLHTRMFGDVWTWAGQYRTHDTNIGAPWPYISTQLRDLLADVVVQAADPQALPWSVDELAVRFHHRLVVIHPFPNGNGRHSRLAADLLVTALGRPVFTWGAVDLGAAGQDRKRYLSALRHADEVRDYEPLVVFARS